MYTRQFGGRTGVGTEYLLVKLIDRIKQMLEDPKTLAVILSSYDWKGVFGRLNPTVVAVKIY